VVVKSEEGSEVELEVEELPHKVRDVTAGRKEDSAIENGDSGGAERNDDDLRHGEFEGTRSQIEERDIGFTAMSDLEIVPTFPLTPPYEYTTENDLTSRSRSKSRSTPDSRIKSLELETPPNTKATADNDNMNNNPRENDAIILQIPGPRKRQKTSPTSKQPARRPSHPHLFDEDVLARRRLQLRRSQAAYRARRELAITSLRNQVEFLEATQKEMRGLLVELWGELGRRGVLLSDFGCDGEKGDGGNGVGVGFGGKREGEGEGEGEEGEEWVGRIRRFLDSVKGDVTERS